MSVVSVPDTAVRADSFDELAHIHGYLRDPVHVSFSVGPVRIHDTELLEVLPRALRIRPAGGAVQVVWWRESEPTPPVWVWTLADEHEAAS